MSFKFVLDLRKYNRIMPLKVQYLDLSRQSNGKLGFSLQKLQCICLTLNMRHGHTTFYICLYPIFNERDPQKFDTVSVTGEITCNDAKPCFSLDYLTLKYSWFAHSSTRVGLGAIRFVNVK